MAETFQLGLFIFAVTWSVLSSNLEKNFRTFSSYGCFEKFLSVTILSIITACLLSCFIVVIILHEPVPRIHDEFSYLLMANTFSSGHVSNSSPPLTLFFDTFHVLMRPTYASKYFPSQGVFLAIGQRLTRHSIVGVWLSSALACGATYWMLEAWIAPAWALFGTFLMVVQIGIFSYWSQSYWGGMVAALGGALFFGATRRLWDQFKWQNSLWLGLGLVILATSRPLEGVLAAFPLSVLFLIHLFHLCRWRESGFWPQMVVPTLALLLLGAIGMGAYNRAITGSAFKFPYVLHEEQYQESPPFIFMSLRKPITYSSFWVWDFYHNDEVRAYESQHTPRLFVISIAQKLRTWWMFYCGILLTPALVLPELLKSGRVRYLQIVLIVALVVLGLSVERGQGGWYAVIDALVITQIAILWRVFDDFWPRAALATCCLLLLEMCFSKWFFPHYFAPATCLVLFLQVEGLRRVWHWKPNDSTAGLSRSERRRLNRKNVGTKPDLASVRLRNFVLLLPVICVISLCLRVAGRRFGWSESIHGPDRDALLMDDWSLRRAELDKWLEQQSGPQLVFVRYSIHHNVFFEWVYNHADLVHSHVIWARDLGTEHDKELLNEFPTRTAWVVDADDDEPQLIPYAQAGVSNGFSPARSARIRSQESAIPRLLLPN